MAGPTTLQYSFLKKHLRHCIRGRFSTAKFHKLNMLNSMCGVRIYEQSTVFEWRTRRLFEILRVLIFGLTCAKRLVFSSSSTSSLPGRSTVEETLGRNHFLANVGKDLEERGRGDGRQKKTRSGDMQHSLFHGNPINEVYRL
jgi:hypothetical protein